MYYLNKENYAALKKVNLEEMSGTITLDDSAQSVDTENFHLLLIILNEEITVSGMDDRQEHVTSYGKELYALYDELLAQKSE